MMNTDYFNPRYLDDSQKSLYSELAKSIPESQLVIVPDDSSPTVVDADQVETGYPHYWIAVAGNKPVRNQYKVDTNGSIQAVDKDGRSIDEESLYRREYEEERESGAHYSSGSYAHKSQENTDSNVNGLVSAYIAYKFFKGLAGGL